MKLSNYIKDLLEAQKIAKEHELDPEIWVTDENEILSQITNMELSIGTYKDLTIAGYIMLYTEKEKKQKNE